MDAVVQRLLARPPSEKACEKAFEYMHKRAAELAEAHWRSLREHPFVPVRGAALAPAAAAAKAAKPGGGAGASAEPKHAAPAWCGAYYDEPARRRQNGTPVLRSKQRTLEF